MNINRKLAKKILFLLLIIPLSNYLLAKPLDDILTVSDKMKPLVTGAPFPYWNDHPQTDEDWKVWVKTISQGSLDRLPELKVKFELSVESIKLGNVPAFIVTPSTIADKNKERILLHFHGGGYVLNPGEAGLDEAMMMAGYGKIKVISIDYRMPPDFPFPAAMKDAFCNYPLK